MNLPNILIAALGLIILVVILWALYSLSRRPPLGGASAGTHAQEGGAGRVPSGHGATPAPATAAAARRRVHGHPPLAGEVGHRAGRVEFGLVHGHPPLAGEVGHQVRGERGNTVHGHPPPAGGVATGSEAGRPAPPSPSAADVLLRRVPGHPPPAGGMATGSEAGRPVRSSSPVPPPAATSAVAGGHEPRAAGDPSLPGEAGSAPLVVARELVVINVMARGTGRFNGEPLVALLRGAGLAFGEPGIFHRHVDDSHASEIIYSVADILHPGTFDLGAMATFATVGVVMFMEMPNPLGNRQAFEAMLTLAKAIGEALDGEVKDDQRNVLSAQTEEHYRQRISDFDLRVLSAVTGR